MGATGGNPHYSAEFPAIINGLLHGNTPEGARPLSAFAEITRRIPHECVADVLNSALRGRLSNPGLLGKFANTSIGTD